MAEVPVEDLAYMAGFFDGEGCVTASPNTDRRYRTLRAYVVQNKVEPLLLFQKYWPAGTMYYPKGKKIIQFYTHSRLAVDMLTTLLPFLIVKREQAELAITWYDEGVDNLLMAEMLKEMKK